MPIELNKPVGAGFGGDFNEVMKVKRHLMKEGYYKPKRGTGFHGYVESGFKQGIKNFQKDNGLKVDGFLLPNGETVNKLNDAIRLRGVNILEFMFGKENEKSIIPRAPCCGIRG